MKKILSLLLMLFMGMTVWAENVDFSAQGYENGQAITAYAGENFTVTFDKGTNQNSPKYYNDGTAIRVYGGGYFIVSSTTKTISKIELTFGSGDKTNEITTDVATYSNGIWEGTASSVKFTVSGTSGHRRIKAINVTLSGETPPEPPTPTITEISTVAEFLALENNKEFKFTGNLVCVQDYTAANASGNGQSRYLYVADETGGIVIYNPGKNTPLYETKDVVPSGWTATKTIYNGLPEATGAKDIAEATETQHLEPIEMTIDETNASTNTNYGAWVKIKNVLIRKKQQTTSLMEESGPSTHDISVMITDGGGNNINLYSTHTAPFNLPTDWETDTRYNVVGILGVHNSTKEIYPTGIMLNDEIITSIETIDNGVKKVAYYNMQGIESSKPFDGLNIVVTEYENGTKKTNKQIYKF